MRRESVIDELWEEVLNNDTYNGEIAGFRIMGGFEEEDFTKEQLITIIQLLDEELKGFGEEYKSILVRILREVEKSFKKRGANPELVEASYEEER